MVLLSNYLDRISEKGSQEQRIEDLDAFVQEIVRFVKKELQRVGVDM